LVYRVLADALYSKGIPKVFQRYMKRVAFNAVANSCASEPEGRADPWLKFPSTGDPLPIS
jgi:hypothetical protein